MAHGTNWAGTTPSPPTSNGSLTDMAQETTGWTRDAMAARAAQELEDGYYVNLGIGIPTPVANHAPTRMTVKLQSGNAMLGLVPFSFEGDDVLAQLNAHQQHHRQIPQNATHRT